MSIPRYSLHNTRMPRSRFLPAACLLFATVPVLAAPPTTPAWQKKIDAILAAPAFKNASVGVCVRSLDTGAIVYARDPDRALVPASNQKLLTAATALRVLGPTFTFRTTLLATARPDTDGMLRGDLYLRGSGDPSLTSARLDELAKALATSGVRRVVGRIVGDDSAFDDRALGEGWQWDDEPFYYQAQVSGLNCDENIVTVAVAPGPAVGADAIATVNGGPASEETYVTLENRVVTVAAGKGVTAHVDFDRVRGQNRMIVRGTIPLGAKATTEELTVENPARFTASRFALALARAGITVETPLWIETGRVPDGAVEIGAVVSKPLPELLRDFLKPSDNLYGETLLKAIGAKRAPIGTTADGATAISSLLRDAHIATDGLTIADGSGLSRFDTVTPRLLCDLLVYIDRSYAAADREAFRAALPLAGTDGTLRRRFLKTPLVGKVSAKTGSLGGVSSLSGYLAARGGKRFAFSILMNHYAPKPGTSGARAAQDAIVTALYEQ